MSSNDSTAGGDYILSVPATDTRTLITTNDGYLQAIYNPTAKPDESLILSQTLSREKAIRLNEILNSIKEAYDRIEEEKDLVNEYLADGMSATGLSKAFIRSLAVHAHKGDLENKMNALREMSDILSYISDMQEEVKEKTDGSSVD